MAALVVRGPMLVADDDQQLPMLPAELHQTYAGLERMLPGAPISEDVLRLLAQALQESTTAVRELIQNARDIRHPKRSEKRLRQIARDVVQEELFDLASGEPFKRKKADKVDSQKPKGHSFYTPSEFETKLRETIRQLCDPEQLDKLTIKRVCELLNVASSNTLWGMLEDYGYAQPGETLARCLRRLADEWHPEWRGLNRQRF